MKKFFRVNCILVHSHFDLASWLLALEASEPVSEPVTFSTAKESVKATFFFM